jgi:IS66 C-terminal element
LHCRLKILGKDGLIGSTDRESRSSAGLNDLAEMDKANGLDPTQYLEYLFDELHRCQTNAEIDALMFSAVTL